MPEPKKRHTKSSRNQRRSHIKLEALSFITCPNCKETILPHRACPKCGFYKGVMVLDILDKEEKKKAKRKAQGENAPVKEKKSPAKEDRSKANTKIASKGVVKLAHNPKKLPQTAD